MIQQRYEKLDNICFFTCQTALLPFAVAKNHHMMSLYEHRQYEWLCLVLRNTENLCWTLKIFVFLGYFHKHIHIFGMVLSNDSWHGIEEHRWHLVMEYNGDSYTVNICTYLLNVKTGALSSIINNTVLVVYWFCIDVRCLGITDYIAVYSRTMSSTVKRLTTMFVSHVLSTEESLNHCVKRKDRKASSLSEEKNSQ